MSAHKLLHEAICAGAIAVLSAFHAQAASAPAGDLAIAKQGYLFAGGKYQTINGKLRSFASSA